MDTSILNIDENSFADLFGVADKTKTPPQPPAPRFGAEESQADIFAKQPSATGETTLAPVSATGETTLAPEKEVDILGKVPPAEAPKDVKGITDYFTDRINKGKFVKITIDGDDGKPVDFIPKTEEELDQVIDMQLDYRMQEAQKELDQKWYASKTPAWQLVGKYAEMIDDPSQLIPFLQGVRNIQTVSALNENEIDDAEKIVRARMETIGEPDDVIDQNIETLKTQDRLLSTAKSYKPLMVKQEQQMLSARLKEEEERDRQNKQVVADIRDKAIAAIEAPLFGKYKLKMDEKEIVYSLIGTPQEETKGYAIYTALDDLFDKRDFETLTQIALLLGKKDALFSYADIMSSEKTAASLEKKLRVAGESRASGKDMETEPPPVIHKQKFPQNPRFGR